MESIDWNRVDPREGKGIGTMECTNVRYVIGGNRESSRGTRGAFWGKANIDVASRKVAHPVS
jgi:hypothetical protein